jgi:predicted MPP superfamily phosphohydrolase
MDLPAHLQLRHGLVVSGAEIALRPLPSALAGTRLLLITDVHAGPFLSPETLQGALARLLALAPDLILLGGDLVTSRVEEVRAHLPALGSLRAPLGVFAVLGNHDHYTGHPALLRELLGGAGIQVLHNEAVPVRRDGSSFVLAGIDDLNVGKPDLEGALADAYRRDPGAPVILLSHNPDVFPEAARRGVALVLSGHTHGGQIRVPGFPAPVRMSRYGLDEGRFSLARSELVVSRGLGVSGVPFRVACSSEAVLITLRNGVVAAGDPLGGR